MADFFNDRELTTHQTQEEQNIMEIYRNLPTQKKEQLCIYLKMLIQYKEE